MTLTDQLRDYIRAAFAGIWIQTQEPDEAQREIVKLAQSEGYQLDTWDCATGMWSAAGDGKGEPLRPLKKSNPAQAATDITHLAVLWNYHLFLKNSLVMQQLQLNITEGKSERNFFVILSPIVQLPVELEKLFVVIEHQLPDKV